MPFSSIYANKSLIKNKKKEGKKIAENAFIAGCFLNYPFLIKKIAIN